MCFWGFWFLVLWSIPQSVDSVSRIEWCLSIQILVAPSRRSNRQDQIYCVDYFARARREGSAEEFEADGGDKDSGRAAQGEGRCGGDSSVEPDLTMIGQSFSG